MKQCKGCQKEFPNRMEIDGKIRNLHKREYCLDCSPFGKHNTKKLDGSPRKDQLIYKCGTCGADETQEKFYGNKRSVCTKCHNVYTLELGRKKRQRAIEHLGGECARCGYDRYYGAIDIHHKDPTKKDDMFSGLRGWSWKRILKEIEGCEALCRVCHAELHAGIIK